MFEVRAEEGIVLGRPRLMITDYVGSEKEQKPRFVDCAMVSCGRNSVTERFSKLLKKYGPLTGAAIISAMLKDQVPHGYDVTQHLPLVMGAISSAIATSWKSEIGTATHDFTITTGDTVKTALYTSSATLGASTTAYSSTNEISGAGYTAGGATMANATPVTSGTTAIYDWADVSWTSASFTANGSESYNSSKSNKAIFIIAFGSDQTVTAGTFTIQWPVADASNAIIRIA